MNRKNASSDSPEAPAECLGGLSVSPEAFLATSACPFLILLDCQFGDRSMIRA